VAPPPFDSGARAEPSPRIPDELRRAYLASLPEPQELFVEALYQASRKFLIQDLRGGAPLGYAAVSDATLVELFLRDPASGAWAAGLDSVVTAAGVERVLCKTFDAPLLHAALGRGTATRTVGRLFRRLDTPTLAAVPRLEGRSASAADVDEVLAMHDGFFADASEIQEYIAGDGLLIHVDAHGEVLGCGLRRRVVEGSVAVDVGMVVAPRFRGRGFGARIVANVASRCLAAGDRPICGCAVENVASRRSLEAAGFRSEHELVEVRVAGTPRPR